jgi:hypothetical protein
MAARLRTKHDPSQESCEMSETKITTPAELRKSGDEREKAKAK